jgi:hypothetical protein
MNKTNLHDLFSPLCHRLFSSIWQQARIAKMLDYFWLDQLLRTNYVFCNNFDIELTCCDPLRMNGRVISITKQCVSQI